MTESYLAKKSLKSEELILSKNDCNKIFKQEKEFLEQEVTLQNLEDFFLKDKKDKLKTCQDNINKIQVLDKSSEEYKKLEQLLNRLQNMEKNLETGIITQESKINDYFNSIAQNRVIKNIIELNTKDDSIGNFKNEINENKKNQIRYYYTIHTIDNEREHWLNVIQESNNVLVLDSLGCVDGGEQSTSDQIFKKFIQDEDKSINYCRSSTRLQYKSGVCEMYALKLPFYLLRQEVFNNDDLQPFNKLLINMQNETNIDIIYNGIKDNDFIINKETNVKPTKKDIKKPLNKFHPVLENGLNEQAFAEFKEEPKNEEEKKSNLEIRKKVLKNQIEKLKNKKSELIYSVKKLSENKELVITTFNEMFLKDLEIAQKLVENKYSDLEKDEDIANKKFLKAGHMYWQTASALKEFEELEQKKKDDNPDREIN